MGKESILHPPPSFVQIENGIYCAGAIYPSNFSFLKGRNLCVVVTLSPNTALQVIEEFYKEQNIKHITLGIDIQKKYRENLDQLIKEALVLLLDRRNHPILFHSTSYG